MTYSVYIIECSNGSYYTGYTIDVQRRYQEHLEGSSKCKYTRSFPPVRLVASWEVGEHLAEALRLEHAIKRLSKPQKLALIQSPKKLREMQKLLAS